MRSQLRSELVKLRSTRTNLGLLAAMIGLALLITVLMAAVVEPTDVATAGHQRAMFGLGLTGGFIAALVGVMSICSEFRHGTIKPTLIFTLNRGRVLAAKLMSSVALGALFGLIAEALAFGTGIAILSIRGIAIAPSAQQLVLIALGSVAVTALLAALGVGFGAVVRNQVFAVIGLVVWFMVIENTVFGVAPSVGRFFPLAAGDALGGIHTTGMLSPSQGALILVGYVAAFFFVGLAITRRRDVN